MPNATPPPQSVIKGGVWISWDSGTTWQETSLPVTKWHKVACSADGNILFAVSDYYSGYDLSFCVSTNSGLTWTSTNISALGVVVPPSGPGGISEPIHPIYTSTNSGATWKLNSVPAQLSWSSIASSADGTKFVAVGTYGGRIWISQSKPTPAMQIMPTKSNLKLSWIVPSTNFVLQGSADLSNWTDLANQPALNLTNLQNEVSLPFSGSGGFYRLKTP